MLEAARGRHEIAEPTVEGKAREINEGDMLMLFDGGRAGVDGNLLSYFSSMKSKVRRTMYVMQDTPQSSHGWTNARALLPPSTTWRAFTLSHANCPRDIADKHKHYNGSLKSDVKSLVVLLPLQKPIGT